MRNRAKCKLCKSILESFHQFDYVSCKCGEISISGGNYELLTFAKDFANFLRVDDQDNEVIVKIAQDTVDAPVQSENTRSPTKTEKLQMLEDMMKGYENLPQNAFHSAATNADLYSVLLLLYSILKEE